MENFIDNSAVYYAHNPIIVTHLKSNDPTGISAVFLLGFTLPQKQVHLRLRIRQSLSMAAVAEDEFKSFLIVIKNHYDPIYSLQFKIEDADCTVGKLKEMIEDQHKGNPSVEIQMLVFRGKLLDSRARLSKIFQSSASLESTMCIHMTLRGGNTTAKELGLNSATPSPQPPSPEPCAVPSMPKMAKMSRPSVETGLSLDSTILTEEDSCPTIEEEKKQSTDPPNDATTPLLSFPMNQGNQPFGAMPPPPDSAMFPHLSVPTPRLPPIPGRTDIGNASFPPPPSSTRASHFRPPPIPPSPFMATVPNPYFPTPSPHPLYYPSPHPSLYPAQSLGHQPPALIEQRTAPTPSPMYPMHPGYHPAFQYLPMTPYRTYPFSPAVSMNGPATPMSFQYPPSRSHRGPPPIPQHRSVPSRKRNAITPKPRSMTKLAKMKAAISALNRSKSECAKKEEDDNDNDEKVGDVQTEIVRPRNRNQNGDIAAVGGYGIRRRRRVGADDANGAGVGNERQNVNNAFQVERVDVDDGENGDDAENDGDDDQGPGFLVWFVGALNINVLIRLGVFMWFIGSNLSTYRYAMVSAVVMIYYLHQVGFLQYLFGNIQFGGRDQGNEPRHRDPNAPDNDQAATPPQPLSYVELIQRALVGFAFSLWPTWDHRQMYPAHREQQ